MDITHFENLLGFADAFTSILQEDKLEQEKVENHPITEEDIPGSAFPHFAMNI